jgi:hypothetical protein
MLPPGLRAAVALLLVSLWMGLLFAGFLLHGALHLLLAGAAALFPWKSLPPPVPPVAPEPPGPDAGRDEMLPGGTLAP